jgi:hypothetical protein
MNDCFLVVGIVQGTNISRVFDQYKKPNPDVAAKQLKRAAIITALGNWGQCVVPVRCRMVFAGEFRARATKGSLIQCRGLQSRRLRVWVMRAHCAPPELKNFYGRKRPEGPAYPMAVQSFVPHLRRSLGLDWFSIHDLAVVAIFLPRFCGP